MNLFSCPPGWLPYLEGGIAGTALGYLVRWAQGRWRIFWVRHFDHSQGGSDGSTF